MSENTATRAAWLAPERAELAAGRILDVAEQLFVEQGVSAVTMRGLASAVGCSRATLYRYYPGKSEVLAAYVDRAATGLGTAVAEAVHDAPDPATRLVNAVLTAVRGVRDNPALSAWFVPDSAGRSTSLALVSPAIEHITTEFLAEIAPHTAESDLHERARWLVRVIVSLLTSPAESAEAEAALLHRFVVPVVLTPG
ncbi:TetR/AcrR family transcriptional regulator [Gordonia sp. Z-3]|jgi:AcrR family transcriptional regulator|uniref:TetR/AcrR family transcriptional regulator n=2 Tax=Gordonia TaxID=2053 RepID=A0A9X3I3B5_9ACTN|nr:MULTISPECIES: TetR/AcrR family transcriptional regulator [Gordonia]MAU84527.1 TetR family transcriptional regulator [Gordonia sp. (in: high G+C Gram-positive bacteria)]MCF3939406.1 TetR/AcrR family transcriptional regulator [Gordonia tangerina]MCX2962996.1 TetR/AcrR family transcriptional regulator [Gordonia aquimaris]MED5802042.1 TetR/AcrR family transcriptional regulator [Gordonia sp. Z-3]